jgi:sodium/hydrogen exchanger-like protein 6/7/sodium/hydrogen exchanger 8
MIKYSATISATDSVAALTLIKASEFPKMFSIIFGEGMVNDAVAIILFKVVGIIVVIQAASSMKSRPTVAIWGRERCWARSLVVLS